MREGPIADRVTLVSRNFPVCIIFQDWSLSRKKRLWLLDHLLKVPIWWLHLEPDRDAIVFVADRIRDNFDSVVGELAEDVVGCLGD